MKNSFDEKILDEAKDWITANQSVVLATVIQTWGIFTQSCWQSDDCK